MMLRMTKKFKISKIQEMPLLMIMVLLISIEPIGLKNNPEEDIKIMKEYNLAQN